MCECYGRVVFSCLESVTGARDLYSLISLISALYKSTGRAALGLELMGALFLDIVRSRHIVIRATMCKVQGFVCRQIHCLSS